MTNLLQLLGGWKGYAAVAIACLLAGAGGTWRVMSWKEGAAKAAVATAQVKQADKVITRVQNQAAITADVSAKHDVADRQIQASTGALLQKVPAYVTPQVDLRFPVPVGAIRLLNAASLGLDLSAVPDPAGRADDAPSGVALSTVVDGGVANAGACRQDDQQLSDLEAWILRQQQLAATGRMDPQPAKAQDP